MNLYEAISLLIIFNLIIKKMAVETAMLNSYSTL